MASSFKPLDSQTGKATRTNLGASTHLRLIHNTDEQAQNMEIPDEHADLYDECPVQSRANYVVSMYQVAQSIKEAKAPFYARPVRLLTTAELDALIAVYYLSTTLAMIHPPLVHHFVRSSAQSSGNISPLASTPSFIVQRP